MHDSPNSSNYKIILGQLVRYLLLMKDSNRVLIEYLLKHLLFIEQMLDLLNVYYSSSAMRSL